MGNYSHIKQTINEVNKLLKLEKNIFKKIRPIEKPIARFIANFDSSWEVRVLKYISFLISIMILVHGILLQNQIILLVVGNMAINMQKILQVGILIIKMVRKIL